MLTGERAAARPFLPADAPARRPRPTACATGTAITCGSPKTHGFPFDHNAAERQVRVGKLSIKVSRELHAVHRRCRSLPRHPLIPRNRRQHRIAALIRAVTETRGFPSRSRSQNLRNSAPPHRDLSSHAQPTSSTAPAALPS